MRNKWIYTMFVLVLSLFAACSDRSDDQPADKGKTRTVVFRLSVDDAVGSRAAWSDAYKSGDADVPFDTRINMNELQIVVYTTNNNYIGKAENVFSWPVSGGENNNGVVEYELVGDLSHITAMEEGLSYKFMVLANCEEVDDDTNVGLIPFDYAELNPETGYIPMWGVKTITLTGDENQDLGTIHLLRAAAKIEVALGTTMADYQLESVTISRYNIRGHSVPTGWNTVGNTEELDREACANFHPSLPDPITSLSFINSADKKNAQVYVPEYRNTTLGNVPATITVRLKRGVSTLDTSDDGIIEFKDAIQFCEYTEAGSPTGELFDIVRNHHYRFTITGVSGGLEIQYAVMDWEDAGEVKLDYTYPTYHNPLLPEIPTSGEQYVFDPTKDVPKMYYTTDGSGAFKAYFHITAPIGQRWTPTFKQSQENYMIQVWNQEGTELLYETGKTEDANKLTASDEWFQICVLPLSADGANTNVVNLGITCIMGDIVNAESPLQSTPFYLLINGTANGEIRWFESGNDPRFIAIKHVAEPQSTNP